MCVLVTQLCLTVMPWTVVCQAPLSTGFSRQEYWYGFLFPSPGDLPESGIKPESLVSPTLSGPFFTTSASWETQIFFIISNWDLLGGPVAKTPFASTAEGAGLIRDRGTKIPHVPRCSQNSNNKAVRWH